VRRVGAGDSAAGRDADVVLSSAIAAAELRAVGYLGIAATVPARAVQRRFRAGITKGKLLERRPFASGLRKPIMIALRNSCSRG